MKECIDALEEMVNKAKCSPPSGLYFYAMYGSFAYLHNDSATIKYATKYIELQPNQEYGYYYKAKALNELDSDPPRYDAAPDYQKVLDIGKDKITDDNKSMVVDAYIYHAYFAASKSDFPGSKSYIGEVLKLDSTNKKALDLLDKLPK